MPEGNVVKKKTFLKPMRKAGAPKPEKKEVVTKKVNWPTIDKKVPCPSSILNSIDMEMPDKMRVTILHNCIAEVEQKMY